MTNNFLLELDTTPPEVSVVVDQRMVKDITYGALVSSNEQLDNWQDIYLIDKEGARHNLIFSHYGSSLEGEFTVNELAYGLAHLHINLRDEVHNAVEVTVPIYIDDQKQADVEVVIKCDSYPPEARVIGTAIPINVSGSKITIKLKRRE